jgi:hypothetical protein
MPTARQLYSKELDKLINAEYARVATSEVVVRQRVQAVLTQLRDRLARMDAGQFTVATTRQMIVALEASFANLSGQLNTEFGLLVDDTVRRGIEKIIGPMDAVGFAGIPAVNISQGLINTATRFTARLITTDVLPAALAQIESILTQAALTGLSPATAINRIGSILPGAGPFGTIASRATTIYRTESLRMYSIVAEQQLQQTARIVPGMEKEWLHTGIGIQHPRSGHVAYSGTRVKVNGLFEVAPEVGGVPERLRYPRDPLASAANTVSCACSTVEVFPRTAKSRLDDQVLPLLAGLRKGDKTAIKLLAG